MGNRAWRAIIFALIVIFSCGPGWADTKPEGYDAAQRDFDRLPVTQRVNIESLLVAGGYMGWIVGPYFTTDVFEAVEKFQTTAGFERTGRITEAEIEQLNRVAAPQIDAWKLRAVTLFDRMTIWVPDGLDVSVKSGATSLEMTSRDSNFVDHIEFLRNENVRRTYRALPDALVKEQGLKIFFKWISDDGSVFIVGGESNVGRVLYVDEYQYGRGAITQFMVYDGHDDRLLGSRLHILLANVLASSVSGSPWIAEPPWLFDASQSRRATDQPKDRPPSGGIITGTGIFVTSDGHVLTNAHVVRECKSDIQIRSAVGATTSEVLASDKINDLAILKTSLKPLQVAKFRPNVRLGESVAAFGYPLSDLLATSGNFTLGNITATAGLSDDSRYYQISAPVQPGNSGGPLVDSSGDLIGVVSAKLDALNVMQTETNGDIPQNVNFAIKAAVAQTFLSGNNITVQTGTPGVAREPADLADMAKAMAVFVSCKN